MENKTHWKKLTNPNYLGAYAFQPGEEKTVTIKEVKREAVQNQKGTEECTVAYFKEDGSEDTQEYRGIYNTLIVYSHLGFKTVHIVNGYRGGRYGFVSSHAANFMAIATLLTFITRQRLVLFSLVTWTLLQCYSRMYLGVHYPGDILGGLIVGALAGWLVWCLMRWIQRRWRLPEGHYTRFDATLMASAAAISVISLLTAALIIQ